MTTTTATEKPVKNTIMTPIFRVSYPNVFKTKAVQKGTEPKFSIQMLFPKDFNSAEWKKELPGVDMKEEVAKWNKLRAAVTAAAVERWGSDKAKWPANLYSPLRDGDKEKPGVKEYAGKIFGSANAKEAYKPGLIDHKKDEILEVSEFYGGCYARATLSVFAYDNVKKGVGFGLRNIQKIKDGEPFGSKTDPQDDFDAVPVPGDDAQQGEAVNSPAQDLGI